MRILLKAEDLQSCVNNEPIEITAYLPGYDFSTSAKGVQSITGTLECEGKIPFRVWSGTAIYAEMKAEKLQGIYEFKGKVNEYNGSLSLILTEVVQERKDLKIEDYVESPYDGEKLWQETAKYMKMLSKPAFAVYKRIMTTGTYFNDNPLKESYLTSTAAVRHHDAYISGLIGHTLKVTHNVIELTRNYPRIMSKVNMDVLILGALLHDIGKTVEYRGLGMSEEGELCSHLSLGIEIISRHRDYIIEQMGKEGYYRLHAVITQHHGEYGDRPRTLEAWLIHKADDIEAKMAALDESYITSEEGTVYDGDTSYRLR